MNDMAICFLAVLFFAAMLGINLWQEIRQYRRQMREREKELQDFYDNTKWVVPYPIWEYDDGFTMSRKIYRHGKVISVLTFETIKTVPKMRPFKTGSMFGDPWHRPEIHEEKEA